MRRVHALHALLTTLLLGALMPAPFAAAGTADDPEATDPAGDVTVTDGLLTAADFPGMDLRKAWFAHTAGTSTFTLTVESEAAPAADAKTYVSFAVGDTLARADSTGATLGTAPNGTTVAADGPRLVFTFPLASVDAKPQEEITSLVITRTQTKAQTIPVLPSQTATDRMPDSGPGRAYEIPKAPSNPAVNLDVIGGTISEKGITRAFTGANVTTTDGNATATWRVRITNAGNTDDTFQLEVTQGAAVFDRTTFTLAPNGTATANLTRGLDGKSASLRITATSEEGASANATATLTLRPTGTGSGTGNGGSGTSGGATRATNGDWPHTPIPAWTAPLTPLATSIGFVSWFGPFAEIGFMMLSVLLLVMIVVFGIVIIAGLRG